MPRWVFAAAVLTLAVAFPAAPAKAGWFSHHGGCHDECAPSCATPCEPTCCAPVECAPACEPTCCAPAAPTCGCPDACGEVYCDGCYEECEPECCLKRCARKLWDLEKRKNRCLKDTFFGWRNKGGCHDQCYEECAPVEYYQPSCGAPTCGVPCGCH